MKIYKKILCILSLVLITATTVCAANEMPFSDVDDYTPYYESIQRIYDKGILHGYEDNRMHPNKKITVAEGITLAEKLFGDADNLPQNWSGWFEPKCGWKNEIGIDQYYFMGNYGAVMTNETAAELLLKMNDLPIINPSMWDIRTQHRTFSDYTNTLYVMGYKNHYDQKYQSHIGVTRAEFCNMLCFVMDYDGGTLPVVHDPIIEPELYENAEFGNEKQIIISTQSQLIHVDEDIRRCFLGDGFKVVIVPNGKWADIAEDKYVGLYNHNTKTIYVRYGYYDVIPHEFGHYIHSVLECDIDYNIKTDREFKNKLAVMKYNGDNYYLTSDEEFFAEAYELYCTRGTELKAKCEEVYSFIDNAVKAFVILKYK